MARDAGPWVGRPHGRFRILGTVGQQHVAVDLLDAEHELHPAVEPVVGFDQAGDLLDLRTAVAVQGILEVADACPQPTGQLGDLLASEDQENDDENVPKPSKFGITVRKVTPEMADRLDIPAGKGVIVQDVKPGSFAEDVNLARGDIILEINKQKVNSIDDFDRVQSGLKSGQDVVFLVRQRGAGRNDGTIFLAGTLP